MIGHSVKALAINGGGLLTKQTQPMKKAFLVTFSVTTRIIADVEPDFGGLEILSDADVDRAFGQAQFIMQCQSADNHFERAVEDTDCPYSETDNVPTGPSFDDI